MEDLFGIALRISITYLFILALMRFAGKRSIDSLSPFDFLLALILGDLFDDIFWAEVSLAQGLTALTVLILLHTLVEAIEAHSNTIHKLVASTPALVIDHAAVQQETLRKERTAEAELWADLRIQGEDDLLEVREAYFEPGGQVSILPTDAADTVRKKDKKKVIELIKK